LSTIATGQGQVRYPGVIPSRQARHEGGVLIVGVGTGMKNTGGCGKTLKELNQTGGTVAVDRANLSPRDT
jgi:hypothetical protein